MISCSSASSSSSSFSVCVTYSRRIRTRRTNVIHWSPLFPVPIVVVHLFHLIRRRDPISSTIPFQFPVSHCCIDWLDPPIRLPLLWHFKNKSPVDTSPDPSIPSYPISCLHEYSDDNSPCCCCLSTKQFVRICKPKMAPRRAAFTTRQRLCYTD